MSDKLQACSQLSNIYFCFVILLLYQFFFFLENNSRYDKGGHLFLPSYVMRTHGSRKQADTMRNIPGQQMQKVFEVYKLEYHLLFKFLSSSFFVIIGQGQFFCSIVG